MKQKTKSGTQILRQLFFTLTLSATFAGLLLLYIYSYYLHTGSFGSIGFGTFMLLVTGWVYEPFHWIILFPVTIISAICTSKVAANMLIPDDYQPVLKRHLAGSIGLSLAITLVILIPLYLSTVCTGYITICP